MNPIKAELIPFSDIEREAKKRKRIIRNSRGVYKIEDLEEVGSYYTPYNAVKMEPARYRFLDLIGITDWILCGDQRRYGNLFKEYTTQRVAITTATALKARANYLSEVSDDFWRTQMSLFNREFRNDQDNTLYIGLDLKVLEKKLGRPMTSFEYEIQKIYNKTFKHLTCNKAQDRIKVVVSW